MRAVWQGPIAVPVPFHFERGVRTVGLVNEGRTMIDIGALTEQDWNTRVRIRLVFSETRGPYDRGTTIERPLKEALWLLATGESGFDYSGALIMFRGDTLSAMDAKLAISHPRMPPLGSKSALQRSRPIRRTSQGSGAPQ